MLLILVDVYAAASFGMQAVYNNVPNILFVILFLTMCVCVCFKVPYKHWVAIYGSSGAMVTTKLYIN